MKNKTYKKIAILCLLLLLTVLITYFYKQPKLIATETYPITFNVTKTNLTLSLYDTLDFGSMPRPGRSTKQINITNDKNYAVMLENEVIGQASQFVKIEKHINIPAKTNMAINVTINVNENTSLGHYEGELIMKAYRGKK